MRIPKLNTEKLLTTLIAIGFVIWGAAFIYKSSFIALDGKRYFSLFDDAMISMRYAWNFSHNIGLVWNRGEFVQGYTNLLMTLLMAFPSWILDKSNAVLFIQILGMGFMLAIAFTSMEISDHIIPTGSSQAPNRTFIRVLTFFCALSYYPLVYWSLMGMETGLLSLLTLSAILFAFRYTKSKKSVDLFLVSVFLGLAFLTRNDSLISAVLIFAYIFWDASQTNGPTGWKKYQSLFAAIGFILLFVIAETAFQYFYYGEFLPNTYTLKLTGMPLLTRLANGFSFVTPFLIACSFILVLSFLEVIFDFQKQKLLIMSLMLSTIAYQIYVGGDPWVYWRIMAPMFPVLTILFISTITALFSAVSNTQTFRNYFFRNPIVPEKYLKPGMIAALILVGLVLANASFWQEITLIQGAYQTDANGRNINLAIALDKITTPDASIGVLWAGTLPYYLDRKSIDFLGKSDRYIANLPPDLTGVTGWNGMSSVPGHNKYDLFYSIKKLQPTYVQTLSWGGQNVADWAQNTYEKVDYEGLTLYLFKKSPDVLWKKLAIPASPN